MRNQKVKDVALSGVLFALAMVLSFLESTITPLLGLAPGIKLGLSNIVVMYALFFMGGRQALTLAVLKAFFVLLTRGAVAGFLSLCGGVLSLTVMLALYWLPLGTTPYIISVCGALAHNIGQLIGASCLLGSRLALTYAPVLIISALFMGSVTAGSLAVLLPALGRIGYKTEMVKKNSKK